MTASDANSPKALWSEQPPPLPASIPKNAIGRYYEALLCDAKIAAHACPLYWEAQDDHQRNDISRRRATHFRVINAFNENEIQLPHAHLRIRHNTTLEWLLPHVSEALEYPASHVQLILGSTTVKYIHRIRISERSETRLPDLARHVHARSMTIQAAMLQRPEFFVMTTRTGVCVCAISEVVHVMRGTVEFYLQGMWQHQLLSSSKLRPQVLRGTPPIF